MTEKFEAGAYLVVILVPVLVGMMLFISHQYSPLEARARGRTRTWSSRRPTARSGSVVPIPGLNRAVVQAINVARSIERRRPRGATSPTTRSRRRGLRADFERQIPGVPLVVVESPYRALVGPLLAYLDVLDAAWPPGKPEPITFVVIPEYVARRWWERILYNQAAKRLRTVLLGRPHTVVVNVPYRREDPGLFDPGRCRRTRRRPGGSRVGTGGIVTAAHVRDPHPRLPASGRRPQRRSERRP